MEILELFKQPVMIVKLKEDLKKLLLFSLELKKNKNGRNVSNLGGFQSNNLNINESTLSSIKKNIINYSQIFAKDVLCIKDILKLTSIWINVNGFKDYNMLHNHPFSKVSGVFYIKSPDNCGNIGFTNDVPINNFIFNDSITTFNGFNSPVCEFKPEENMLILFPSWLNHFVKPNLSKNERISISFNLN